MRTPALATIGLAIILAACGGGDDGGGGGGGGGGQTAVVGATMVEISLTDRFQIRPSTIVVAAGVPVTFKITNSGTVIHDFFLGDQAAHDARELELADATAAGEDGPMNVFVGPGETKELVVTLEAGTIFAECHMPQHYIRGEKATVEVVN